ncbi:MAG TPA: hypothetical protein VFA76_08240 [Terriglobales bacterium]|nr:hypothetical protein [Terriglobales bacterium]
MKSEQIKDLLAMLKLIQPEQKPAARIKRFVDLYRTIDDKIDFKSLPEAEYDELFSALSTACGFEDPLDALEAVAQAGSNSRRSAA